MFARYFLRRSCASFFRRPAFVMLLAMLGLNGIDARAAVIDVDSLFPTTTVSEPGYRIESASRPPDYSAIAATVTVGVAGLLSQIDIQIAGIAHDALTMSIMPVTALAPSGDLSTALASFKFTSPTYARDGVPTFPVTSIDTASAGLNFAVGERFAIVITPVGSEPTTGWGFGFNGPNSRITVSQSDNRGAPFIFQPFDIAAPGLATYVEPVPLPTAAWLLISGIGGMGIILARRRKVEATTLS